MSEEILEFIKRRFSIDCNWTSGNCYWFAKILTLRFIFLKIFYDPIEGHFVAMDTKNNVYYDFEGEHIPIPDMKLINFENLLYEDPTLYSNLIRDCRD